MKSGIKLRIGSAVVLLGLSALMYSPPAEAQFLKKLTKGLEKVEPGQASILATIEPFVAAAVGMLCFAEPMTMSKAIGMLLIFCSIVILNIREK